MTGTDLLHLLADKFAWMESQRLRVGTLFMHQSDIDNLPPDQFDRTTHKEHLDLGIRGTLWGADVLISEHVYPGWVAIAPAGMKVQLVDDSACMKLERTPL